MKKTISLLLCVAVCFGMTACGGKNKGSKETTVNNENKVEMFYDKVSESNALLDIVADDIYSNWYDYVYEDEYSTVYDAVSEAQEDNSDNLEKIEDLDSEIVELFKKVKGTENGEKIEKVMNAYSDYYELVVNVSGSFEHYSENKENMKKELSSALRSLSYEVE